MRAPHPAPTSRSQNTAAIRTGWSPSGWSALAVVAIALTVVWTGTCGQAQAAAQPAPTRDEHWRADLRCLVDNIHDIHPKPYWQTPREEFDSAVAALDRRIPRLEDHQVVVELMRIVALLRDGHSGMQLTGLFGFAQIYPVRVYRFQDGFFVMSAAKEYGEFVGARVLRIGGLPVQEAFERVDAVANGENEYTRLNRAPGLLMRPLVLHALGISDAKDRVRFEVEVSPGKRKSFVATPISFPQGATPRSASIEGVPGIEYQTARDGAPGPTPLCWRDFDKNYWFEYVPEHRLLWVQFNSVLDAKEESLERFCERLFDFVDHHDVDKLAIDLRFNGGGNLELLDPLLHGLIKRDATVNRRGHLFTVIGRRTYSAAHVCAALLEAHTHTLFVGEPSGATPNHFGDNVRVELPYSKIPVIISKWPWQVRLPWDRRPWIAPQLPAPYTLADYRSNRDPALEAILKCDHDEPGPSELVREKMEKESIEAGAAAYRDWKPRHPDIYGWTSEAEMNSLGYRYLQDHETEKAMAVLKLNLETYPNSAQAVEMLGEVHQFKGERDEAIQHYERALEMDPKQRDAAEMLRRIEKQY
jgi:tetratricopeptide (TPR) repeat protein